MSIAVAFILGIVSVLLMAAMVLGVLAFVRINKLTRRFESEGLYISNRFDDQYRLLTESSNKLENQFNEKIDETNQLIESHLNSTTRNFDDVYREMDSRLDKLDNRLSTRFKEVKTSEKQIIND